MPWVYQQTTAHKIDDLYAQLQNQLNTLQGASLISAKLTAADEHRKDARGVLFFNNENPLSPPQAPARPSGRWTHQEWHTQNEYDKLYQNVTDKLNDLSFAQAFYAIVCFTNKLGGDETMALFWQEASGS